MNTTQEIRAIQFSSKKPDFDFDNIRDCWCDIRHMRVLWEAASLITPEAEKYVMRSVSAYNKDPIIKDNPWLKTLVDEFMEQEREHTKIHKQLNKALGMHHIDVESKMAKTLRDLTKDLSKLDALATAAALEHLFFSVIKLTFIDTGFYKDETVDPKVLDVFRWHWCEELEHHSVTLSLLAQLDTSYKARMYGAYNTIFKFLPVCSQIILEVERFHYPKYYLLNTAIDMVKISNYFRKGFDISAKYFKPEYDIVQAGEWSWPYIEEWRKKIGYEESVQVRSNISEIKA